MSSKLNGIGLGLRWDFLEEVLERPQLDVAFFEVSPENYMRRGGWYPAALEEVKKNTPLVTHGLTLSIGATDDPSPAYLEELRREVARCNTPWHSDHLCFSTAGPLVLHDLLPLKLCQENVRRVSERIRKVQDQLGLPFAIENISWYAHLGKPEMPETEFINEILEQSDGSLLLDVNNVWVNAKNHGFDPKAFIAELPRDRVVELHIAGHTEIESGLIVDTHGESVRDEVLDLFSWTIEWLGPIPVLLERDNNVPPLDDLLAEVNVLKQRYSEAVNAWEKKHAASA